MRILHRLAPTLERCGMRTLRSRLPRGRQDHAGMHDLSILLAPDPPGLQGNPHAPGWNAAGDTTAEPSLWTFEGVALSGPAKGHRLAWVPAVSGFWFAWYAIYPESRVEIPGL